MEPPMSASASSSSSSSHLSLILCLYGAKEGTVERSFSKTSTLDEVQQTMRDVFKVDPDKKAKLWIDNTVYIFNPNNGVVPPEVGDNSEDMLNGNMVAVAIEDERKSEMLNSTVDSTNDLNSKNAEANDTNSNSLNNRDSSPTSSNRQASTNSSKPIPLPDSTTSQPAKKSSSDSLLSSGFPVSSTSKESYPNQTLADVVAPETSSTIVTLEVINSDGTWPSCRPRYKTVAARYAKTQPGLCGLGNIGNTCFMNSALQCLSNTPPLTNYILADKFLDDINRNNPLGMHGEIARTYAELIKVIWSGENSSVLPREFKCAVSRFAPQFGGFAQQDCQELMAFLLDGLHEDLNRIRNKPYIETKTDIERRPDEIVAAESWANYKKRNDSIVVDTFHAILKSTLVCPGCELVSVTFDPFCYLSLPLPVETSADSTQRSSAKQTLQLKDCISQFTSVERLGADDPWYCPKCKKHQQATKKFDIWSLPKVLIIHLKRFSSWRSWRDKIDSLVEFPVDNLDMTDYVLDPNQKKDGNRLIYNLIGVANHMGGLGGGHYTADAKNFMQNSWYSFDDAFVTPIDSKDVVTKSAYVLFYQLQEEQQEPVNQE